MTRQTTGDVDPLLMRIVRHKEATIKNQYKYTNGYCDRTTMEAQAELDTLISLYRNHYANISGEDPILCKLTTHKDDLFTNHCEFA